MTTSSNPGPDSVLDLEWVRDVMSDPDLRSDCRGVLLVADGLLAAVERVLALADSMERESPKPAPGGFLADQLRLTIGATR